MTEEIKRLMPKAVDLGRSMSSAISHPIHHRESVIKKPDMYNPHGKPTLMGYILPEWQRPLVWTEAQMISFIESAWKGIPLGTWSYNQAAIGSHMDNLLIDGQQRMYALSEYLNDAFPVFGYRWSEITKVDRRFFEHTSFHCYVTETEDEEYLRDYYNLMNFGGTAHTADQRA